MTANPVELIGGMTTTESVSKADLLAWVKARVPQVMEDADEVRETNLGIQRAIILRSNGLMYFRNTEEVGEDDGITVIRDENEIAYVVAS